MKLIVLSDSHGDTGLLPAVIERENPDILVHLGDYAYDALALRARFPALPLYFVRGNNDYGADCADEEIFEACGKKIFITHGHTYHVKLGLGALKKKGALIGAGLALFGHTHRAYIGQSGETGLFNPGAAWGRKGTYGVVELEEAGIKCEVKRTAPPP
jgi:hypothetical protein